MITPPSGIINLATAAGPLTRSIFRAPGSDEGARDADYIFMWILWFDIFWFVLLMGLVGYWVVKYRRRPGVPAQRTSHHNTPLEIAWTVIPSLFLGYMFFIGFEGYLRKMVSPVDAVEISVTGTKWKWLFRYPNGASPAAEHAALLGAKSDTPVLYLPQGRPVRFRITSADVMHSFWIPDFRSKIDALPNRYTSYWIDTEATGDHWIFCAEYCGDEHSEMAGIVRIIPAAEYDAIMVELAKPKDPIELGKTVYKTKGCAGCHTVDGSVGTGPTWLNSYAKEVPLADGSKIPAGDLDAWDNYIRESILTPNVKLHAGFPAAMTPYAGLISDDEIQGVIAYFRTLSDAVQPGDAPAEAPQN